MLKTLVFFSQGHRMTECFEMMGGWVGEGGCLASHSIIAVAMQNLTFQEEIEQIDPKWNGKMKGLFIYFSQILLWYSFALADSRMTSAPL